MKKNLIDVDPTETQEWVDALDSLIREEGVERADYILTRVLDKARRLGVNAPLTTTDYINTIATEDEVAYPGDLALEERIDAFIRWNAMAMVVRASHKAPGVDGHISTFASSAILYEVGLLHFFRSVDDASHGDCVYMQGHSSPGIYAFAYLMGCLSAKQLDNFRQEVGGEGISSYPHPWLMPDFWQFPTVSMGLGPIQAIYQARFLKYLQHRGLQDTSSRKVWVFCGDGEMDEPESVGALHIAQKEQLDNLIFVINCNLQRLDGPVRGNGKIIQELESHFRGVGFNVIKVIWGTEWDELFARDTEGLLRHRMMDMVDGDYQLCQAKDGSVVREVLFGGDPRLLAMVEHLSDATLFEMRYGGLDRKKVYAAYKQAVDANNGRPTVILAKSVKGYGLGPVGQAQNTAHNQKKLALDDVTYMRDRFKIPLQDKELAEVPYMQFAKGSTELNYLQQQRKALGGDFPKRKLTEGRLPLPDAALWESHWQGGHDREYSTTMAFVRILSSLLKDKSLKDRIVPIVADESRTFGMEGLFRQLGIYSIEGQLYKPVDSGELMYYKEDIKGQLLEEGLTEAGAFSSWLAAATSYNTNQLAMLPFYIYYSMFGFQRIGDLAWAAGDQKARGFLIGATAGRTTLSGEGLQHEDGHSHVMAALIPNCISYDPTFHYELAVIIEEGLRRMYDVGDDVYYYITVMNENYLHPAMPEGVREGIIRGLYCLEKVETTQKPTVQLLGSGTILREVIAAKALLQNYGVEAQVWSAPSFNELYREAWAIERDNRLHPEATAKVPYVTQCLAPTKGPILAATDYVRAYAEPIRAYLGDRSYTVLGTDGFGRSDTRRALRQFFEVDSNTIAYASLKALYDEKAIELKVLQKAMKDLGINPNKENPVKC